jgi:hypothetical protein
MKIYEPAALRLQHLAESDRERQRHITIAGSPGDALPQGVSIQMPSTARLAQSCGCTRQ